MGRRKVTASLKSDNCVLFEDLIRLIHLKLKSIDGDEIDAFECINNELNKERRITVRQMYDIFLSVYPDDGETLSSFQRMKKSFITTGI